MTDKRRFTYTPWWILSIILVVVVGLAGWRATEFLGNAARQEIIRENEASLLTLSTFITSELQRIEGAAKSLSGAPKYHPV